MLHQRMIDDRDAVHGDPLRAQNTVPSLMTVSGGPPPARLLCGELRPAAQVPPSSTRAERERLGRDAEPFAHQRRERSSSATVSARHSTTSGCRPGCGAVGIVRIAQREHAGVDEQAAIAIFGEAGEAVDVGHR